jgi:hypothetical protein
LTRANNLKAFWDAQFGTHNEEINMPFEPLKAEDISLVNRLLPTHPDLHDTISIIKQVNAKAKYPITSFDDLAQALGGENGTFTFRGRTMSMAEARGIIPAYYFPIASEADLAAKIADLGKALPPLASATAVATGTLASVIKLMAASAVKPSTENAPQVADEEVLKISGFGKQRPAAGGLS